MTTYTVTGSLPFRGHKPGEIFEEDLPADIEMRSIARGSISFGEIRSAPTDDRIDLHRDELDEIAVELDIDPEEYRTKAVLLTAIQEAEAEAPAAEAVEPTPENEELDESSEEPAPSGNDE